ncbi:MAG: hypothetical protein WCD24_20980 [Serratia inhibens]|uniref:hypothetical protein n=1 Tax=Serratia inhibens TaxID=2338073 RepID=UPI003C7A5DB8
MNIPQIRVAIDIGSRCHRVAIGRSEGDVLEEFDLAHTGLGFQDFFRRVTVHERRWKRPVVVAMEGFNGHARPLDSQIRVRGVVPPTRLHFTGMFVNRCFTGEPVYPVA